MCSVAKSKMSRNYSLSWNKFYSIRIVSGTGGVGCEGPSWASQNDGIHGRQFCLTLLTLAKPVGLRARCSQGQPWQWHALFFSQSWKWLPSLQREAFFWTWGMGGRSCPPAFGRTAQMEMPPGKDVRPNNPHFIWEGWDVCLSSQGYVFGSDVPCSQSP